MNPYEWVSAMSDGFNKTLSPAQMHQRRMAAMSPKRRARVDRRIDRVLDQGWVMDVPHSPGYIVRYSGNFTPKQRKNPAIRQQARKMYRQRNALRAGTAALVLATLASGVKTT